VRTLALAALCAAACAPPRVTAPPREGRPPPTPVRVVDDVYHGRRVSDPYRWLEDLSSPEVVAWLRAQNAFAREALDGAPGRAAMLERLTELDRDTARVDQALVGGADVFFVERPVGRQKLCVRRKAAGRPASTLVDIESSTFSDIDYFAPSPDGRLLAYGASEGGSEDSTLFVVEADGGRQATAPVPHATAAAVTWAPEGDAFYYSREPERSGPEAAPARRKLVEMRVYRRRLAGGPDAPVFGHGLPGSPFVGEYDLPRLIVHPASPFVLGVTELGVGDPLVVAAKRVADLGDPAKPWRVVAPKGAGVFDVALRGRDVYALTYEASGRNQLVRYALGPDGDVAGQTTVMPPAGAVLQELRLGGDALYVSGLEGARSRLFALGPVGAPVEIALPADGVASALAAAPSAPGCVLRVETWTHAPRWLRCDASGRCDDLGLAPPSPVRFDDVEARSLAAKSADGTDVPLTLLARRGTPLDGKNPTWLWGYGSYGTPLTPNFRPERRAWFDAGGVIAVAHVRGGGEFGRAWHQAAAREKKVRAIEDYLACAEALVRERVTSPERLAAYGRSAGGILVGGAITRRPDLFGAAFVDVGALNMVRIDRWPNGPPNAEEFGSVDTPEGFRGLLEMDAYHHVTPGARYPAVLLATGINDPRQPAWSSAKMAAALQAASASGKPVLLRVDFEGGHGGAQASRRQRAELMADAYSFLLWQLGASPHARPGASTPRK
jgi:prolyl oligopeptidase